jgi:signal transduction histidine kinase
MNLMLQDQIADLKKQNSFVIHEMRTPLTSIRGYAKILAMNLPKETTDPLNIEMANSVVRNAEHMQKMIDEMRYMEEVSNKSLKREQVDLSDMMNKLISLMVDQTKGRNITFSVTPGLKADCDAQVVRIAVFNLLKNSVKYSSKHPTAQIQFGWDEKLQAFFVKDDGAGFDPSKKEKLFNMFKRLHTSNEFEGTGVGLAMVKKVIVDLHGGKVWAESEGADKGATFYFTLEPETDTKA